MTKNERIVSLLERMDTPYLVQIHNEYCELAYCEDGYIYYMEELDEALEGCTPLEIIEKALYGDFNPSDNFFFFDGYANLKSFSYIGYSNIDIEEIANYAVRYSEDYYNPDIRNILESEED